MSNLKSNIDKLKMWIDNNDVITLPLAKSMFFSNNKDECLEYISNLKEKGSLKTFNNSAIKSDIYYTKIEPCIQKIQVLKYIDKLVSLNVDILDVIIKPSYLNGTLDLDAFVSFKYFNLKYLTLLKIDNHYNLSNIKINKEYEKLYLRKSDYNEFENTFPIIIISRPNEGLRYNSYNFETIYTDLNYTNLDRFLL